MANLPFKHTHTQTQSSWHLRATREQVFGTLFWFPCRLKDQYCFQPSLHSFSAKNTIEPLLPDDSSKPPSWMLTSPPSWMLPGPPSWMLTGPPSWMLTCPHRISQVRTPANGDWGWLETDSEQESHSLDSNKASQKWQARGQNSSKLSVLSGEGNGTPLQYSCLENPMDGGAW